jgi:DNA-directed RNA polymerase beta' subunit
MIFFILSLIEFIDNIIMSFLKKKRITDRTTTVGGVEKSSGNINPLGTNKFSTPSSLLFSNIDNIINTYQSVNKNVDEFSTPITSSLKKIGYVVKEPDIDQIFDYSSTPGFIPPIKKITGVKFTFLSREEIDAIAVVDITDSKMEGDNTVYDLKMGAYKNHDICITCGQGWNNCPGHFGRLVLPLGIPHPIRVKVIADILTCFCAFCHRLVLKKSQMRVMGLFRYTKESRFKLFVATVLKVVQCSYCEKPHGKVIVNEDKFFRVFKKNSDNKKLLITNDEIVNIFSNIRDDDYDCIGISEKPINLIITAMLVLPPCTRLPVQSGGNSNHDDMSYKYIEIVKICQKLKTKVLKEKAKNDLIDSLTRHIRSMMDNAGGKDKDPGRSRAIKSIKQRLISKGGQIRTNIQGKRRDFCSRSVIGTEPNCKIHELIVPEHIAKTLSFPEHVNNINNNVLQNLINDGKANYVIRDGKKINLSIATSNQGTIIEYGDKIMRNGLCIDPFSCIPFKGEKQESKTQLREGDKIIRVIGERLSDGTYELVRKEITDIVLAKKKFFKLKDKDIVGRQLKNGDWVIFNRQPTLWAGSMRAKQIRIMPGKSFRFNPSSTEPYNADHDGDKP